MLLDVDVAARAGGADIHSICLSEDAEVCDEMHHRQKEALWLFSTMQVDSFQVSVKGRKRQQGQDI